MTSLTPTLAVIDGIPRASSLDIADHFGKQHKDVMRAINNAITQVPEDFAERNFALSEYQDSTGRNLPKCDLTHDGFSFVVMGFTGKKAAKWKVVYIMAFRAMAEELTNRAVPDSAPALDATLTPAQQSDIHNILAAKIAMLPKEQQGGVWPQSWERLKRHFKVAKYDQIPQSRYGEAVTYLIGMEITPRALPKPEPSALPAPEHPALVPRGFDGRRAELAALQREFTQFGYETIKRAKIFRERLQELTGPLYKEVFLRLTTRVNFDFDPMFYGWHRPSYAFREDMDKAVEDFHAAIRQAQSFTEALRR